MNGAHSETDGVSFDSSNIGKKEKPNYFERVKKKSSVKDFLRFAFDGRRKFVTIGIIVAVVAAIVVLILWLAVWSRPASDGDGGTGVTPDDNWSQQLADISSEANAIFNSDSENSFSEAVSLFDSKIEETEDSDRSFDLRILRAVFLNNNGGAQMTINDLARINENELSDEQRYRLFLSLAFAYRRIGDEESAKIFDEKINQLPSSVTNIGG